MIQSCHDWHWARIKFNEFLLHALIVPLLPLGESLDKQLPTRKFESDVPLQRIVKGVEG